MEGVSEPWLSGEDEREGDSRKRLMAGWFSTVAALLAVCWNNNRGCRKEGFSYLLI